MRQPRRPVAPRTVLRVERLEDRTTPAVVGPFRVASDPGVADHWAFTRIAAPAAWDHQTGTGTTVVAVIDSGIDAAHPDLAANLWTNSREVPGNGRDDDANGYTDDAHGYDFTTNTGSPRDADGH